MSLDPGLTIAALLGLLVLSAFLSAARTALAEASRTRLSELHKKGEARAERVLALLDSEERTSARWRLWHGAGARSLRVPLQRCSCMTSRAAGAAGRGGDHCRWPSPSLAWCCPRPMPPRIPKPLRWRCAACMPR